MSRFVLALEPQQVKEAELHVCPLIEGDTHHVKFTNVSHATFMVELCKSLAARLAAVDIEDDSNAAELDLAATEEKEKPIAVTVPADAPSAKAVGEKRQHTLSAAIASMASVAEKEAEALIKSQGLPKRPHRLSPQTCKPPIFSARIIIYLCVAANHAIMSGHGS